ncbi:MAG: transketolase [Bacteroidales bacterium]|nr:transketolase [Bacteroidales bacterium]
MSSDIQKIAQEIRIKTFKAIHNAGGGHFGGSLSAIEILTTLYYEVMRYNPENPKFTTRDRLVLSKGHAGPPLYIILAEKGFFPKEMLVELDQNGGRLPKHVDRLKVPGIEVSTGPLGQGFSVAAGMAAGAKADNLNVYVYVVLGDGECNEGQVWETAMNASKYKLDNLIAIVDRNTGQVDGCSDEVMCLDPFAAKWEAFGWHAQEIDGHATDELLIAFEQAKKIKEKPSVIIANTVKGKGVSFMENVYTFHHTKITDEQYLIGLNELEGRWKNDRIR